MHRKAIGQGREAGGSTARSSGFQTGQVSQVDDGEGEGHPRQKEVAGMRDAGRGVKTCGE